MSELTVTSHLLTRGFTSIWNPCRKSFESHRYMVKMSAQDNQNGTPDSWDQSEDGGAGDQDPVSQVTKPLSALNVNAPVFVPGQNIHAREFVPSFVKNSSENEEADTMDTTNNKEERMDEDNNLADDAVDEKMDGEEEPPPDDWEEKGSDKSSSEASTEDDTGGGGDIEMEGAEAQAAVKPKKKTKPRISISETKKDHINIVFIGHVDAGKSTIGGHIMYLTGMVEKRTLEKYEKEAREKNRESWYLSWALDTNQEERDKGKTVEVGRAYFETDTKHFTILDAPGHRSFVPNMIGGASQADLAVLVISARKGEFETGFERGGQTREHAMLVKTAGVRHLIVLVNKMDDPTVEWDEERYNEIKERLTPYLKKCGFNPKTDIFYIPVSGLTGANLKNTSTEYCSWYQGPPFIQYLDKLPSFNRMAEGPVRVPIVDRYKDMGTLVLGKVESGVVKRGQTLTVMPNKTQVEVMQLFSDEIETEMANPGENVKVKLKNVEEEDVSPGFVLCSPDNLCHTGTIFDAQIVILEHKSIICAGYSAVLHIHTCAEEVKIKALLCLIDKKTGDKSKTRPRFVKQDQVAIARLEIPGGMICLEPFKEFAPLGRFTLRDEGKTIGIGKVLKVLM